MPKLKSLQVSAHRFRRSIKGLRDQTGSGMHLYHTGVFASVHSAPPPPVAEYDAWLAGYVEALPASQRSKVKIDGATLRRWVIMRKQGSSFVECGRARAMTQTPVRDWLGRLPEELRP